MTFTLTQSPNATQSVDVPQTLAFTATPAGNNSTVAYQWQKSVDGGSTYGNASGAGNATSAYTFTASDADVALIAAGGVIKIRCRGIDQTPDTAYSTAITINEYTTMTIVSNPTNQATAIIALGETKHITTNKAGGKTTFTYAWYECDNLAGDNPVTLSISTSYLNYAPISSGDHFVKVLLTDSADTPTTASSVIKITVKSFYDTMTGATGYLAKIAAAVS